MMSDPHGIGLLERTKVEYPDMSFVVVTGVQDIYVALAKRQRKRRLKRESIDSPK
jgi:hypothetical protein